LSRIDLTGLELHALQDYLSSVGQPKFRAKQIYEWIHQKRVQSFDEMSNLPKALRGQLKETASLTVFQVQRKLVSKLDGTVKYLYALPDGECVETVMMRYQHGNSLCVSSQVGCKMGCAFCASTKAGFVRNLTAAEILEQVYQTERDLGLRISHIVLMGIGEPLDNYDEVLRFLRLINSPLGANISLRNISLSTCGLVDRIDELAKEKLGITLSISLHASDNETRDRMMPVNHRYPMEQLLAACKRYTDRTGRRISFEYACIAGENDRAEDARRLAHCLKGQLCHINLIPVNAVKETDFHADLKRVKEFQKELTKLGMNATIRRTLGADISAACGQLRRDKIEESQV